MKDKFPGVFYRMTGSWDIFPIALDYWHLSAVKNMYFFDKVISELFLENGIWEHDGLYHYIINNLCEEEYLL